MAEEGANPRIPIDDDGRIERTGTVGSACAHIITAMIGSGVLCLPWAVAQLGWVAGPAFITLFAFVTYLSSALLSACYRAGDPVKGERNYTYVDALRYYLGASKVTLCGLVQYLNLFGLCVGYTVAASISVLAIKRSNCFHESGGKDPCHMNTNFYMIIFGGVEIILSQIPNVGGLWWLPILVGTMSFTYSTIGLGLGIGKVIGNGAVRGSITGIRVPTVTPAQKIWRSFQALGDIAFAYSYSMVLIEIQDTIKSPPPESETMNKAAFISVVATSLFYMLCACFGFAALGDSTPGILLSGFGFYNPYWLIDIANAAIAIHLVVAYQVSCQPLFVFVERHAAHKFPNNCFFDGDIEVPIPGFQPCKLRLFRLVWRTTLVVITTVVSMVLPFFTEIVGLLGALSYWALTVYFPVQMFIVQKGIPKWSAKWVCLNVLSIAFLIIGVTAAAGSIAGIVRGVQIHKPFKTNY